MRGVRSTSRSLKKRKKTLANDLSVVHELTMENAKAYAFQEVLDASFEEALDKVTEALQSEGFGVLTEIDVKAVLKKKLDQDFRKYVILGACNPPFALQCHTLRNRRSQNLHSRY